MFMGGFGPKGIVLAAGHHYAEVCITFGILKKMSTGNNWRYAQIPLYARPLSVGKDSLIPPLWSQGECHLQQIKATHGWLVFNPFSISWSVFYVTTNSVSGRTVEGDDVETEVDWEKKMRTTQFSQSLVPLNDGRAQLLVQEHKKGQTKGLFLIFTTHVLAKYY